jgi:outer membrane murein-binding lipoprotein Lpp
MATEANGTRGEYKSMKRLTFAMVGAASLALAGCHSSNQDAVQNAELNQPDAEQLNELANQAALDANAQAPANNMLQDENAAAVDNTVNPKEADEQNVSGM